MVSLAFAIVYIPKYDSGRGLDDSIYRKYVAHPWEAIVFLMVEDDGSLV